MNSTASIEIFTAINLGIIGLSHFLQSNLWIDFFNFLHSRGNIGNLINALMALGMGSIIVSFHWIWSGPMFIVTLYGVSQVLKALLYLTKPTIGLKSIEKINKKSAKKFKWAGLAMSCLSLFIFYWAISASLK